MLNFATALDVLDVFANIVWLSVVFKRLHQRLFLGLLAITFRSGSVQVFMVIVHQLETGQLLSLFFVLLLQIFKLLLTFANLLQEMSVGLFFGHVLGDHFSYIRISCTSLDSAECNFNRMILYHLFLNSFRKELTPDLLDQELLFLFFLILVVRLVGCLLCDLLLSFYTSLSLRQSFFFVFDAQLQRIDAFLALGLLVVDVFHKVVQPVFRLQLLLSRRGLLHHLIVQDDLLVAQ